MCQSTIKATQITNITFPSFLCCVCIFIAHGSYIYVAIPFVQPEIFIANLALMINTSMIANLPLLPVLHLQRIYCLLFFQYIDNVDDIHWALLRYFLPNINNYFILFVQHFPSSNLLPAHFIENMEQEQQVLNNFTITCSLLLYPSIYYKFQWIFCRKISRRQHFPNIFHRCLKYFPKGYNVLNIIISHLKAKYLLIKPFLFYLVL